MAESEKNARRSDEAERSRHISATESVAFATMLLGLLNDADTALHRLEHQPDSSRAAEPAAAHALPAEIASAAPVPTDPGPDHEDQHAGMIESPAADLSPTIHADATAATPPQDAGATSDHTPAGNVLGAGALAWSPAPPSISASSDHAPSTGDSTAAHGIAPPSFDLGASVHTLADTVTGIVDTALATVSSSISSLNATVGQLTSTLTDSVSHLVDGLTGAVSGLIHDTPATGLLAPPATDLSGLTSSTTDLSGATQHEIPLLDTAGAIPTSLLHPMPLQLGFLGQPTMDGHEPHDGAFSALGVHHF
ncbi:hypothetical protein IVB30_03955 [Bradyrhizobium sp. 200]|uniref:hypothetical protein n=1 Tax=Bradyrhizobium sp. 200 TaxID=2782665 RepID=UPI001FFE7984|nr:hypothetical protein [Bradyrhizobium sp. 200]UPJ50562.1 hypothetical protein IVB30_03955 [Bradyrhizobium sp. 200]